MKIDFITSSSFVCDPLKAPFDPDSRYFISNVSWIASRGDRLRFVVNSSFKGSAGFDSALEATEFLCDPVDREFVLDLSQISYLAVDGVVLLDYIHSLPW